MNLYQDDRMFLDDQGITITSYLYPGHQRHILYTTISDYQLIELGPLSGRHRLVGLGFRRPRNFFHWDRTRSTKTHSIALDTGRPLHPVISPDDLDRVVQLLDEHSTKLSGSS
jgi:hypothetical protein